MRKDNYLDTDDLAATAGSGAVRGSVVTLAGQVGALVLSLASTAIFSRLLSPHDVGLVAMAIPVAMLLGFFRDLGLSTATIQQEKITHPQVSNLFWLNTVVGFLLMLAAAALSPVAAWFYRQPEVAWLTLAYGANCLLIGLGVQHLALLRRRMRFEILTIVNLASAACGLIAGVMAAFVGLGYWSLVVMSLVTSLVSSVSAWFVCHWRPGRPSLGSGARGMVMFGGTLTVANVAYFVSVNLDTFVIGRWIGSVALGQYTRANQIYTIAIQQLLIPLAGVAVPALSRLQGDPSELKAAFLAGLKTLMVCSVPLACVLIAGGDAVATLLLGPQWPLAGELVRILAVAGLFAPAGAALSWLVIAQGDATFLLKWNMAGVLIKAIAIGFGIQWGVHGVAIGMALAFLISFVGLAALLGRRGPVSFADIIAAIRAPILSFGLGLVAALIWRQHAPSIVPPVMQGMVSMSLVVVVGGSLFLAFPGNRMVLTKSMRAVRESWLGR